MQNLKEIINYIYKIKNEIRYSGKEIGQILSLVDLKIKKENLIFQDKALLEDFLKGLGKTDFIGQMNYCDSFNKIFKEKLNLAQKELNKKGKLCLSLYSLLGVGLTIIII